jgi:hypothetical protein
MARSPTNSASHQHSCSPETFGIVLVRLRAPRIVFTGFTCHKRRPGPSPSLPYRTSAPHMRGPPAPQETAARIRRRPSTPESDGPPRISLPRGGAAARTKPANPTVSTSRRLSASTGSLPAGPGPTRRRPTRSSSLPATSSPTPSPFRPASLSTPFCSKPDHFLHFLGGNKQHGGGGNSRQATPTRRSPSSNPPPPPPVLPPSFPLPQLCTRFPIASSTSPPPLPPRPNRHSTSRALPIQRWLAP